MVAWLAPTPPPLPVEKMGDGALNPYAYSKEEMLRIYKEGGGRGGLGLEVERWEGIVREVGYEPVGLKDMGDAEKKVRKIWRAPGRALDGRDADELTLSALP